MALKPEANGMDYNHDKVDEITLALLWLTTFKAAGLGRVGDNPEDSLAHFAPPPKLRF